MPSKTWDKDFRQEAIEASIRKLGEEGLDEPFCYDVSFCLPVAERPTEGWTPRRIHRCARQGALAFNFSFVVFLIGSFVLEFDIAYQILLLLVVGMVVISGIEEFLKSRTAVDLILRRLMKDRIRERLNDFDSIQMISCELADPDANNEQNFFREDDYVLVFFDEQNRCLLIEGLGARYQIRAEDVVYLRAYEWTNPRGGDYRLGASLTCRIDPTTELTIAAVRTPGDYETTQQALLRLFLSRARRNALKQNALIGPFKQTLQYSDATGRAKEEIEVGQSSN